MFNNIANMFIWFANGKYIQDNHGQILLDEKPVFSFEFDSIKYYWNEKVYKPDASSNELNLSQEQINEIENFIQLKRNEIGILGLCIDVDGNYLGRMRVDSPNVHGTVDMAPPNDDDWIWCYREKKWKRQYFYTDNKVYTRKNDPEAVGFTFEPIPTNPHYTYQIDIENNSWIITETSESLTKYKNEAIDDLLNKYLLAIRKNVQDPKIIIDTLKTLDNGENLKLPLIEKCIDDIITGTTISEIESFYESGKTIIFLK